MTELTFEQMRQQLADDRKYVLTASGIFSGALVLISLIAAMTYGCHRATGLDLEMAKIGYTPVTSGPGMWHYVERKEPSNKEVQGER